MKKHYLPILALLACGAAHADAWNSGDKRAHFTSGAVISIATTAATESAGAGFVAGCGLAFLNELNDAGRFGWKSTHVSHRDFLAQCLGAGLGSAGGFIIYPGSFTWVIKF